MALANKAFWCLFFYIVKLVNCCNRCPIIKEQDCKTNEDIADKLKSVNETTQEVYEYLNQNLRELQKMTNFLQENIDTNKMISSVLPQVVKLTERWTTTSKNLEDTSKLLTQVTDVSKTMQDSLVNKLIRNIENSERAWNDSLHSALIGNLKLELQPFDCYDVLQSGKTTSGVYTIYPKGAHSVFCDLETKGGGWTIFLFRQKQEPHQEKFSRSWKDYKEGFGNPSGEYWLGEVKAIRNLAECNDVLYAMTRNRKYKLMLEARTEGADDIWGEWQTFKIDSESFQYKISLGGLNNESTVYNNYMEGYFNNQKFSTFDTDNDESGSNCASDYKGGWWYKDCKNINPTGVYGEQTNDGIDFNNWSIYDSQERYATWLQLKIRPL